MVATPRVKAAARRIGGRPLVAFERRGLTPVLSVVMPVYNVAEYLAEALDSVLTQTLHNLELIAVDDGSTDGSLEILRDYERKDPRVRVLTQPNSGQGPARNHGVTLARGEFLTFVDSDDTVPPRAFAHMIATLRRSGSDFCVGSVRRLRHGQHVRTAWMRTVHDTDRLGTTLEEFPNAMQDILACNRLFRTAFWREKVGDFRGHIAYEDHVPMLTAYVRAQKFDVLHGVTYNWRIRENLSSTGQQKARLQNLLDRIEVKEEAHRLLQAEASQFVYDTWVGRTLEVDFPPFIYHALHGNDGYRNLLAATFQTYLGRASDHALDMVTVRQKIRGALVAQRRWEEVSAASAYFEDIGFVPPARARDGLVVAVVPDDAAQSFLHGHDERMLRLSPLESHFQGVVEHVQWGAGKVVVEGWAVRRALSISGRTADLRAWLVEESGERLDVPIEGMTTHAANLWAGLQYATYDGGGFRATVDLDRLPARDASWNLEVETTYDGITSRGTLHQRVVESAAVRDSGTGHTWEGVLGTVRAHWHRGRGLCIDVDTAPVVVASLDARPGQVSGTLAVPGGGSVSKVRLLPEGGQAVQATSVATTGGLRFTAPWPVPAHAHPYSVEAVVGQRRVRPLWPDDLLLDGEAAARWRRAPDASPVLVPTVPALEVTGVTLDGESLVVEVHAPDLTEEQAQAVALANPRISLPQEQVARHGGGWSFTFGLRVSLFGMERRIAPSARYELSLAHPGQDPWREGPLATVAPSYSGSLPDRQLGQACNLRATQDEAGRFRLHLEPPLRAEELGPANRRRMRDAYRDHPADPQDSVLFGCYKGEFATDNQLALDRLLAEKRPDLVRYWGVADRSTAVPAGSVPLLLDSQEWYDALGASRFLCHNIDFGPFLRLHPHQRYLQTFHGYPFKSMGVGFWRSKGFSDEELQREVNRRKREWDVLLMPSEEAIAWYQSEYDFHGEYLVTGYPRTDFLVQADPDVVRPEVLARLGVEEKQTVVLYAPTYRDWLTTRAYAARRFDALDLHTLARLLGPSYTLLVRGHNNNQRELDRVTNTAQVVDVTDYPDINELTVAADVAVLDYSSLRFDWALTGKPMVFFVPDLEDYFALRPPLFPYEGTAPGPWTASTEEVAAALGDLRSLDASYAADIAAFNARFNALHDGHAGQRVLEQFFVDRVPT
jgi:CDP-glycerol glycerophosphotransferase